MFQPIIDKTYSVEIPFTTLSQGTNYNFPVIQQLNGAKVYGIEAFHTDDIAITKQGRTVISAAAAANLTVTLVVGQNEDVYQVPYLDLRPGSNSGIIRMLNNKLLDVTNCYITMNSTTGFTANQAAVIQFIYTK